MLDYFHASHFFHFSDHDLLEELELRVAIGEIEATTPNIDTAPDQVALAA